MNTIVLLLIISVIGPIVGALLGIIKYPSRGFMFNILAFAAGVMLAISFFNLIPQSIIFSSILVASIGVAVGALLMYIIDRILPHVHTEKNIEKIKDNNIGRIGKCSRYINTGLFIHNLPEGMVIALGTITSSVMGIILAIAITVQKIPEGICTAAPTYYCNKRRFKSFLIACSTLIPLLIGFFIAYFLYKSVSNTVIGLIVGITAGFMIYISTDTLIPASSEMVTHQSTIISLILGVLFVLLLNMFVI
jgi:ZIP family zinc transporter